MSEPTESEKLDHAHAVGESSAWLEASEFLMGRAIEAFRRKNLEAGFLRSLSEEFRETAKRRHPGPLAPK
jgi:hypothetical protein